MAAGGERISRRREEVRGGGGLGIYGTRTLKSAAAQIYSGNRDDLRVSSKKIRAGHVFADLIGPVFWHVRMTHFAEVLQYLLER